MDNSLRDALTIEMRQVVYQVEVLVPKTNNNISNGSSSLLLGMEFDFTSYLEQDRSPRASCERRSKGVERSTIAPSQALTGRPLGGIILELLRSLLTGGHVH